MKPFMVIRRPIIQNSLLRKESDHTFISGNKKNGASELISENVVSLKYLYVMNSHHQFGQGLWIFNDK
jgi:hypothetical protein